MQKQQLIAIAVAAVLVVGLYFGGNTKAPAKVKEGEKQSMVAKLDESSVKAQALIALDSTNKLELARLESEMAMAQSLGMKAETTKLKELSKFWNDLGNFSMGGMYAQKVAELAPTDTAWAIAGTTYGIAVAQSSDPSMKAFCAKRSVDALDKAAQLNPKEANHRINKGLMLLELSEADGSVSPMDGILLIREVSQQDPTNTTAVLQLGRLAMRSGQMDKAKTRFEQLVAMPNASDEMKMEGYFLLAETFKSLDDRRSTIENYEKAMKYAKGEVKERLEAAITEFKNSK